MKPAAENSRHRIASLRVHIVRIPVRAVHSHGSGDVSSINSVLVEIETASGISGWGEASPWPVFTGTVEANAAALHVHLRPIIVGADPFRPTALLEEADRIVVGCPEAKAALETALLDAAGKASGRSASELLGGRCRDSIALSFSVANPDFDEDLGDIAKLHADGVRIFKLKTGFGEHGFDLMRLAKLRELYGDGIGLRVDYNQGLPAVDAIRKLRDLEGFGLDFIEQPVRRHEKAALAAITRALDTPVMADESVFDEIDAIEGVRTGISDVFSLKIMKSGGIRRAMAVSAIARAAGIASYGGCMFETGLAHAAGAHLMGALPEARLGCEFYMATYYLKEDILAEPFPVRGGEVRVPDGPGLGVAVDPGRVAAYRDELLG